MVKLPTISNHMSWAFDSRLFCTGEEVASRKGHNNRQDCPLAKVFCGPIVAERQNCYVGLSPEPKGWNCKPLQDPFDFHKQTFPAQIVRGFSYIGLGLRDALRQVLTYWTCSKSTNCSSKLGLKIQDLYLGSKASCDCCSIVVGNHNGPFATVLCTIESFTRWFR